MLSRSRLLLFLAVLGTAPAALAADDRPRIVVLEPDSEQLRLNERMIYVDEELAPASASEEGLMAELAAHGGSSRSFDLFAPAHPLYTSLRRGLQRYRMRWGGLPLVDVPPGPALRRGDEGERVAALRERLGLAPDFLYDEETESAVREYQAAHSLKADGIAGDGTISSLNLGPDHYERKIIANLERARDLPSERDRYILVDAGAAELTVHEDGKVVDRMRVIVGSPSQPTPMMAALVRYAEVNPYWNLPPDFVQDKIAPRVLAQGLSYLEDRGYQALSGWTEDADIVDAASVDWQKVAERQSEIRVRQLPGPANSMGEIKFMMPNHLGIYLHDTPRKELFVEADRWISNGCVRVEDADRLARWLFGEKPRGREPGLEVPLEDPVPVYITYLTAVPGPDGNIVFRPDPYGRDRLPPSRIALR